MLDPTTNNIFTLLPFKDSRSRHHQADSCEGFLQFLRSTFCWCSTEGQLWNEESFWTEESGLEISEEQDYTDS